MKTRIVIGILIVLAIAGLFAGDHFTGGRWFVSSLVVLLGFVGWVELAAMGGVRRTTGDEESVAGATLGGGGPVLFAVGSVGTLYFLALHWCLASAQLDGQYEGLALALGIFLTVFGTFAAVVFRQSGVEHALRPALLTICGALLLGWLFGYTLRVYHHPEGLLLGVLFFFGIKGNDIVAYFVGRAIGRHRFLQVSPKKTLEGCGAAVVFSVVYFCGVAALSSENFFPWSRAFPAGIILSITTQIGDLSESLVKRACQVKDSSVLLPEFGGVLDMIDSMLFSAMVFWLVFTL